MRRRLGGRAPLYEVEVRLTPGQSAEGSAVEVDEGRGLNPMEDGGRC